MNDSFMIWLADYHLLALGMLCAALVTIRILKQSSQRLAIVRPTLAALGLLAVLCTLPGWSVVNLLEAPAKPQAAVTPLAELVEPLSAENSDFLGRNSRLSEMPTTLNSTGNHQPNLAQSLPELEAAADSTHWTTWIGIAYLTGSVLVVLWLGGGMIVAHRLRSESEAASATLQKTLQHIGGASDAPILRVTDNIDTAVALGLAQPTILLPRSVEAKPIEHKIAILAHELAHVTGGDLWLLAVSRWLLVILWPQPLYWVLRRQMRLDQETLADAAAAEATDRHEYAEQLVVLAREKKARAGAKTPRLAGAVGLWETRSQLTRRIAVLLDEKLTVLRECSRRWRMVCAGLVGLAAVGLSLVTVEPGQVVAEEAVAEKAVEASDAKPSPPETAQSNSAEATTKKAEPTIHGRIVDQHGEPVEGAKVGLVIDEDDNWNVAPDFRGRSTTNGKGEYSISYDPAIRRELGTVWAYAEGYSPMRPNSVGLIVGLEKSKTVIALIPAKQTTFQLINEQKQPVHGVRVKVKRVQPPESVAWLIPSSWSEEFAATTDSDGLATINSTIPESVKEIELISPQIGTVKFNNNYFLNAKTAREGPHHVIPVPEAGTLEGRITASEEAAPNQPTLELVTEIEGREFFGGAYGLATVIPNVEGHFKVPAIAAGRLGVTPELDLAQPWRMEATASLEKYDLQANQTNSINLPIIRGTRVFGTIRKGDTGEGYPSFRLAIVSGLSKRGRSSTAQSIDLKTEKDGRYEAYVLPGYVETVLHSSPRDYQHVEWWKPNEERIGGIQGNRHEVPSNVEEFELPPIELVPTVKVAGKLVDRTGKPLVGWSVSGFPGRDAVMNSFAGVHTNQDGKFSGLVPETVPPTVWQASFRDWSDEYDFEDIEYEPKVISENPLVLRVNVDGQPGARADKARLEKEPSEYRSNKVKPDNAATRPGNLDFVPHANAKTITYEQSSETANRFVVTCQDERGEPVVGAEATLYRYDSVDGTQEKLSTKQTDADGAVAFSDFISDEAMKEWKRRFQEQDFPARMGGMYVIVVESKGLAIQVTGSGEFHLSRQGVSQELTIGPAAKLSGRVLNEQRKPVPGATVSVGSWARAFQLPGFNKTTTDEQGRYAFENLPSFDMAAALKANEDTGGNLDFLADDAPPRSLQSRKKKVDLFGSQIIVTHPDYALTHEIAGDIPGSYDATLKRGGVVTGKVVQLADGEAAQNIPVRIQGEWHGAPAKREDRRARVQNRLSPYLTTAKTDDQGRYRFANVPVGEYSVVPAVESLEIAKAKWIGHKRGAIAVEAGKTTEVEPLKIGLGGTVRGQLIDVQTGKPPKLDPNVVDVTIILQLEDNYQGFSASNVSLSNDGRFEVPAPPGKFSVMVFVRSIDAGLASTRTYLYRSTSDSYRTDRMLEVPPGETLDAKINVFSEATMQAMQQHIKRGYESYGEAAVEAFNKALAIDQNDMNALRGLAKAFVEVGNFEAAVKTQEKLIKLFGRKNPYYEKQLEAYKAGKPFWREQPAFK
ncbi:M56 family metallopeptidase [Adhaeretor mobilis]|uniref:BlaR1 peptidase M56 n=1 Tax=Adhaeretor mobilis TaxID=1930276 RepID=A0A517MUZ8_9BACT|nr:M56 family metallopeptidase [Adhaeretor mobilis]QDS98696.1 BlaR1 peptidase M56 [Adhaeretor mobilis]